MGRISRLKSMVFRAAAGWVDAAASRDDGRSSQPAAQKQSSAAKRVAYFMAAKTGGSRTGLNYLPRQQGVERINLNLFYQVRLRQWVCRQRQILRCSSP